MIKRLVFPILLSFFYIGLQAQNYFVAFFAEKWNLPNSPVGHAFIGIGKGTPLTCDVNGSETEMWGFYPKLRKEGGKSLWAGPVDGVVRSDLQTHADEYYYIRIPFEDYIQVQLKIEDWKKKKYELLRQDCISFFIDIASLFPQINVPDRSTFTSPDAFVRKFIDANNNTN